MEPEKPEEKPEEKLPPKASEVPMDPVAIRATARAGKIKDGEQEGMLRLGGPTVEIKLPASTLPGPAPAAGAEKSPTAQTDPEAKVTTIPTYGDLAKQVARLEKGLTRAATDLAAKQEQVSRAKEQVETTRRQTSREKQKLLERTTRLEMDLRKAQATASKWVALKQSPTGKYFGDDGRPKPGSLPSGFAKNGDWFLPLAAAYKREREKGTQGAMLGVVEQHADLSQPRPKNCSCVSCTLRKTVEERETTIREQKTEIRKLTPQGGKPKKQAETKKGRRGGKRRR